MQSIYKKDLFKNNLVVITGAGTGIGRCTAMEFAYLGATVCLIGRRLDKLQQVAKEINSIGSNGSNAIIISMDICDSVKVDTEIKNLVEKHGKISCLINNAGGQKTQPSETLTSKTLASITKLNIEGTWNIIKSVFKYSMNEHGGNIVIMSASFHQGFPMMLAGAATRAGETNMAKTLAVEWAQYGIRINSVSPGFIFSSGLNSYPKQYQEMIAEMHNKMPAARCGTESEVASTIIFLSSPGASYITGTDVRIDGGSELYHGFHSMFLRDDKPFIAFDNGSGSDLPKPIKQIYDTYPRSKL